MPAPRYNPEARERELADGSGLNRRPDQNIAVRWEGDDQPGISGDQLKPAPKLPYAHIYFLDGGVRINGLRIESSDEFLVSHRGTFPLVQDSQQIKFTAGKMVK